MKSTTQPARIGSSARLAPQPYARRRYYLAALGLILFLAFALRVFQLDDQSIWWDEGISLHLAQSTIAELTTDRLDNIHPPLYFLLLKGWLALVGDTVFSARYFSVLFAWLLVPAIYAVATRWYSRGTGLLAALLAAISAVSVIYAQEIRVYSLLPLLYLALLAVVRELTLPSVGGRHKDWQLYGMLALLSWTALHLHYVSLFAVAYAGVWAFGSFWRARRASDLRRLIGVQLLVLVASLPWFIPAAANWRAISDEANAGTFVTEAVPWRFLAAQVWAFFLTGLAGALSRANVQLLAQLTLLVMLALVTLRLVISKTRHQTAASLAHWLVPLGSALLVWTVRSFSHPRYVAMFAPGFLLLSSFAILPGLIRNKSSGINTLTCFLSAVLAGLLIALSLWGLLSTFFDEDVAKDNIRGAAQYLESVSEAGDLILVPDTDWSLPYEYAGEAVVAMPGFDQGEARAWANLAGLTRDSRRVFTLDYRRGTRDWRDALPFALHKAGILVSEELFDDLIVREWELTEAVSAPVISSKPAAFDGLQLEGVWVEQDAQAGDALALALQWRTPDVGQAPQANFALRLLDVLDLSQIATNSGLPAGQMLATADGLLLDAAGRPSDQWEPASETITYHLLPIPPATPPLSYTVAVELYELRDGDVLPLDLLDEQGAPRGQTYVIPGVTIARSAPDSSVIVDPLPDSLLSQPSAIAPGLVLLDAAFSQRDLMPGMSLAVQLIWQAVQELPDLQPRLLLEQGDSILFVDQSTPAGGRYATSAWQQGEIVREVRQVVIPPDSSGIAELVLELDGKRLPLAAITISAQEHQFEPPAVEVSLDEQFGDAARLIGFTLPERTFTTVDTIPLQLVWQAAKTGSVNDYEVFTHLLSADGRLIAQHDGPPQGGLRPFSSWISGEYIVDDHDLVFKEFATNGPARIEIGLYDPLTGTRVPLQDGSDHLILPVEVAVTSAP